MKRAWVMGVLSCLACAGETGVVTVAPPTGDRERDQASVRAALDSVRPGGTVQFVAGTYLVGSAGLEVGTRDITLRGHSTGTVLRGCTDAQLASMGEEPYFASCAGLALIGARQHVRDLNFEGFSGAIYIRGPADSTRPMGTPNDSGGHVIEGNTFRNSTTVEVLSNADSAITIRGNTFRNVYHAVALAGRNVHVLRNDIAAPEPGKVPYGWPSLAIGVRPVAGVTCTGNRIEGNTIDGHTDAVIIGVMPPDGPGASCHGNTVRDNSVQVRALTYPAFVGAPLAGQPLVGVPIRLLNLQAAMLAGTVAPRPMPPGVPAQVFPPAFAQASVRDNVIAGNRITGAIGVAIELIHASGNRIEDNVVEGLQKIPDDERARLGAAPPFGIGPGFWLKQTDAERANGTPIYSAPASSQNTIREAGSPG